MKKLYMFLFIAIIFSLRCSVNVFSEGGGETTNGYITGKILLENGKPASKTQVLLLKSDYNPVTNHALPDSLIDTTDIKGAYSFYVSEKGLFNILAYDLNSKKQLLLTGINNQNDTFAVDDAILKDPGTIKLFLPDTLDKTDGYFFIKGTKFYIYLSDAKLINDTTFEMILPNLPALKNMNLYYDEKNNSLPSFIFKDNLNILSNDTTIIDFIYTWLNVNTDNSDIPSNNITDIILTPESLRGDKMVSIWCATDKGAACYEDSSWVVYTKENSELISNNVVDMDYKLNILNPQKSLICFATDSGVSCYNKYSDTWTNYTIENSNIPSNLISSVDINILNSDIWIATHGGGIAQLSNNTWVIYDTSNGLPSNDIVSIKVNVSGKVWCTGKFGVATLDGTIWTIYNMANSSLISNDVFCVESNLINNVWFGCEGGISTFDGTNWTTFTNTNTTLLSGTVFEIINLFGNTYVSTSKGLTMYNNSDNLWFDFKGDRFKQLKDKRITSIVHNLNGNTHHNITWFGTINNGIIIIL